MRNERGVIFVPPIILVRILSYLHFVSDLLLTLVVMMILSPKGTVVK